MIDYKECARCNGTSKDSELKECAVCKDGPKCQDCISECMENHDRTLRWPDGEIFDYTP